YQLRDAQRAPALRASPAVKDKILRSLPHTLTSAQTRVVDELTQDLTRDIPTNRMIQGDVGSGKTMVALFAMLLAVESGHQAAMMAPTEILAEQHFSSIREMLGDSEVRIRLLTGSITGSERSAILSQLERGEIDILIGTHALLTEHVRFQSLAVAVIDEQHRFGVEQRAMLRSKGEDGEGTTPHVVVMTATPIPRTLSLTLFGDLDVSVIDELPPGRQPIVTTISPPEDRGAVYEMMRRHVERGEQAYVVVPAIESEAGVLVGVRDVARELESTLLSGLRIAAVHGQLKQKTRDHIMERFRRGLIDVLVATTVIEVGVDVPNATVMVIEQADRFGLAQLHQLRGRVGRGEGASRCVLIAEGASTPESQQRLRVMAESSDGFFIAEKDFEIRGPGEIFGSRQSGMPPFRVADLSRDTDLLNMARRDAQEWIRLSSGLNRPDERVLRRRVLKAHGPWLGIGDVG
ncbi:MAG TPA: ATP-dependent DNA helicase RecG, partial [Phycisphaerales bacterium]|nr:ATP-dependent DNA helicase RecG [Phycisphaerales bacterium]